MKQVRTSHINAAIKKEGGHEKLVKGDGYWYFIEGDAYEWETSSVYVYNLNSYSLEEWMKIWRNFRDQYAKDKANRIPLEYTKSGALKWTK